MSVPAEQAETAALLRELSGADPIETQISALFIGAADVWKLRKAVRLPFLDFSSPDERRRCSMREVELSAPHAPGLYHGVVPVCRTSHGIALRGEGPAIDWVVHMARIPEGDFLPAIAARGELNGNMLDAMADEIVRYHAGCLGSEYSSAKALRYIVLGNAKGALAAGLDEAASRQWLEQALAELARTQSWHDGRTRAGFVRRGHGDLKLSNWCLWLGKPVPIDALDFDEELATTDTAYDLAFLLMDLDRSCGRGAANRVMNRVVARSGDWDMLGGMRLYLSTRAMIRAHISASSFLPVDAADYLARALAYLRPSPPVLLAIGGLPGTGKSTLARAVAPGLGAAPGALILRSDELRKRRFGVAPEVRLPKEAYAEDVSRAVMAELTAAAPQALAAGHSVIADATFMDPTDRAAITAAAHGAPFHGIWLTAELAELEQRVAHREGDASDADVAILRRAAATGACAPEWVQVAAGDAGRAVAAVRDVVLG